MQIVKNFLYNLSYQILSIVLPLITVPYVSNILGAKGIGDYAFTHANMQYFVIFGMVGIALYGKREIAYVRENKSNLKSVFYSIYLLQMITTSMSLLMYLIFIFIFNNNTYKILYLVQGINILAATFDISWLFIGLEQFKKTVVRNTLVKLASLASIFIFVKDSNDIIIYTLILALSALIGNLTFWVYLPKTIGLSNIKTKGLLSHLKSSLALFVPQIAIQIYLLLDRTLLGIMTNNVQVGYYENAQKIVKVILTIATAIGTVMMPKIANTVSSGNMNKVKYYIKNSFFFVSGLSIPLALGLAGIAKELSPWFFGDNFKGIEKLIIVSSLIIISISWSNVLGMQLLVPLNRTKEFTISVTSGAVINFILNILILKQLGAIGACLSTIIAETIVTAVQFYYVRDFIKSSELLKQIIIFIPAGIIMYIAVRIIGINIGEGLLTNIVQAIIGVLVYYISLELMYRGLKKQSIISYIRQMTK